MRKIIYRKLKPYKYQLTKLYSIEIDIFLQDSIYIGKFVNLFVDGVLLIKKGYAWDGPSGPTIDIKSFMRGSLIHDALCQLIEEDKLNPAHRKSADLLLRKFCIEDGMWKPYAYLVYYCVRFYVKFIK